MRPEPCAPVSGDAGGTLTASRSGLNSPSLAACSLSLKRGWQRPHPARAGHSTGKPERCSPWTARQTDYLVDCVKAIMINTLSKSHYSHMCHIIYPN